MRASLEELPEGTAGVRAKIARMRRLIERGKRDPKVRQAAAAALAKVAERDTAGEIAAVHAAVRRMVRYTKDPAGVEMFTDPGTLLGTRAGDCDDMVPLLGAMLESVGHQTRLVVGGSADVEAWAHVWLQVHDGRGWRSLDPTAKIHGLGFDPAPGFPDRLIEGGPMTLGQIHRTPTGGAIVRRPSSFEAQYRQAFGHAPRYAPGVRPPVRRRPPATGRNGHRATILTPVGRSLGCPGHYGGACAIEPAQLGNFFSKIGREIKRVAKKIGKEIKRVDINDVLTYLAPAQKVFFDQLPAPLQQAGFQALRLIPGIGPTLAPLAEGLLKGTLSVEQVAEQIGGEEAARLAQGIEKAVKQARDSGSWQGVATPGFVGPLPGAVYSPNYLNYSRYQEHTRGTPIDICADWGLWTMTAEIARRLDQGKPVRTPDGKTVSSFEEWTAAKRAAVEGKKGIEWHQSIKPGFCFDQEGELVTEQRTGRPAGSSAPAAPGDGPPAKVAGLVLPAVLIGAVLLLAR